MLVILTDCNCMTVLLKDAISYTFILFSLVPSLFSSDLFPLFSSLLSLHIFVYQYSSHLLNWILNVRYG